MWAEIAKTKPAAPKPAPPPVKPEPVVIQDSLKRQIEYYFSDTNWHTDTHLQSLADDEGWIAISKILDFPKLAGETEESIRRAVESSRLLVSDRGLKRRRKRCDFIVVDANALISGELQVAGWLLDKQVYTTVDVLREVRDAKARRMLESLPFTLERDEPSDEALRTAKEAAKRTGDLRSLSSVDLRVIALTIDLDSKAEDAGDVEPVVHEESREYRSRILGGSEISGVSHGVCDDDIPWVGPSMIEDTTCGAACVTADFAMQNVLLQLGLRVVSTRGRTIEKTRRFAVRCSACFYVETDNLERLFCGRCGSDALRKVGVRGYDKSVRQLRPARRPQGLKYGLPKPAKPKTGVDRFQGDLLLREDQLLSGIWKQKLARHQSKATTVFGPDVADTLADLNFRTPPSLVVGYGRKNPNAAKGRERRGKKKL